jgi:hypothetical protein
LLKGLTVVPVILSTDKTRLTSFVGGKQAWPVYMTLGNISKEIRHDVSLGASILVAYLPVVKLALFKDGLQTNIQANLFHKCMLVILAPICKAGDDGVMLGCANGHTRYCYPLLAAYVADNPKQCLVSCCKTSRCFACKTLLGERGDYAEAEPRDPQRTADDLFAQACMKQTMTTYEADGLNPIAEPFWADLPHTNIFTCITLDLLHQICYDQ